ncbi:MAG: hypothetical protein RR614_16055, partial [Eubacterium sp.]
KTEESLALLAHLCFEKNETSVGQSIALHISGHYPEISEHCQQLHYKRMKYNYRTGLGGINMDGSIIRQGTVDALQSYFWATGHSFPDFAVQAERKAKKLGMEIFAIACDGELVGLITSEKIWPLSLNRTLNQSLAITA